MSRTEEESQRDQGRQQADALLGALLYQANAALRARGAEVVPLLGSLGEHMGCVARFKERRLSKKQINRP